MQCQKMKLKLWLGDRTRRLSPRPVIIGPVHGRRAGALRETGNFLIRVARKGPTEKAIVSVIGANAFLILPTFIV